MRRTTPHTHPCRWRLAGCSNRVACDGDLFSNPDGWPEVVCQYEGELVACDECREARARACPDCGVWAFHLGETHHPDCQYATTTGVSTTGGRS